MKYLVIGLIGISIACFFLNFFTGKSRLWLGLGLLFQGCYMWFIFPGASADEHAWSVIQRLAVSLSFFGSGAVLGVHAYLGEVPKNKGC